MTTDALNCHRAIADEVSVSLIRTSKSRAQLAHPSVRLLSGAV